MVKMKGAQATALVLFLGLSAATTGVRASEGELSDFYESPSDPRIFFANLTASLVEVNATLLASALIALAILGAGALALYYLYLESAEDTGYGSSSGYGHSSGGSAYGQYSRSNDAYDFNSLNIIQWISMLQDLYEKFDYNDLECQKRLICEIMREPDYYGSVANKFKNGFQYAKYLEVLNLPDDMRELLDEYLDAYSRSEQTKACEEFFQCPYSIKDSFQRNLGNSL